ncbi:MAG: family 10 glycosylhydrolase [Lentisphaerae bacterium]|nr:family 10 glycosylhydrolase [Lentisphaerota bacterium]
MISKFLSLLMFGACVAAIAQQQPVTIPPPPTMPANMPAVLPSDASPDTLAALFSPMTGSLPVTWQAGPADHVGYARMPINFAGTTHSRASWDIAVKLNLANSRGIQFDLFCADVTPIEAMRVYFRSGDGWYATSFGAHYTDQWNRVVIDKAKTNIEGTPAGWEHVDAIRISFWRGNDQDSLAAVANLAVVASNPDVIVLRAESNIHANDPESKGYSSYAAAFSSTVDALNITCALVSDIDLSAETLESPSIVVLPYNPRIPEDKFALLQDFAARGGKIIACYSLPSDTAKLLGITERSWQRAEVAGGFIGFQATAARLPGQPDFALQTSPHSSIVKAMTAGDIIATWRNADGSDSGLPAVVVTPAGAFIGHVWNNAQENNKRQFLMALLGHLAPKLWEQAARAEYARIGVIGRYRDFADLSAAMPTSAGASAKADLAAAAALRRQAKAALDARNWQDCIALSSQASDSALAAWCRIQPTQADDYRGFWCHSAFGLAGKNWDESIKFLAEHGFNAIVPNMLWGATCYYPSKVLTPDKSVATNGDQVAQCLSACAKYGVKCHVWKVNWNCSSRAPQEVIDALVKQKRTQRSFDGTEKPSWLCPSNPINQQQEIDAMVELVRNYPTLDGIHFDYIRYPDQNGCFCDGCRERFQQHVGAVVENWPRDLRSNDELREQWLQFRRDAINTVVQQVHEQAKKVRPNIQISAAVFNNWPRVRDEIGQDWSMWCERGWLDFVCPMNYTDSNLEFQSHCRRQIAWAHKVPLYPGIGMSCWTNPGDAVKTCEQIAALRESGLRGFMIFNYDHNALGCLPMLSIGATSWPVPAPKR